MKHGTILVVDDEEVVCQSCALLLSEQGHEVSTSQDPHQALVMVREHPYDVILVDLKMPTLDGMSFLRMIKDLHIDTEVIVMTGFAEFTTAVEAVKLGAFDYIPKPFNPDQLVIATEKALKAREIRAENRYLRRELQARYKFETIVGNSATMRAVYDLIEQVSTSNVTVLIRGESGTGKELVARAIHFNSPRRAGDLWRWIVEHSMKTCSRANCLDTPKAPSPAPRRPRRGSSKSPMAVRSSWMKSGIRPSPSKPSCSAYCSSASIRRSVTPENEKPTCG